MKWAAYHRCLEGLLFTISRTLEDLKQQTSRNVGKYMKACMNYSHDQPNQLIPFIIIHDLMDEIVIGIDYG